MEVSSFAGAIHIKARKASHNANFDMRELLGVDKTLQSIHGELVNNT